MTSVVSDTVGMLFNLVVAFESAKQEMSSKLIEESGKFLWSLIVVGVKSVFEDGRSRSVESFTEEVKGM